MSRLIRVRRLAGLPAPSFTTFGSLLVRGRASRRAYPIRRVFAFLITLLIGPAGVSLGQRFSIGSWDLPDGSFGASPLTVIDMAYPSDRYASLTIVKFQWTAAPCPAAVKIKTFENDGFIYEFFMRPREERGPFDVDQTTQTITLAPPLDIRPNEMLGIVALTRCGGPVRSRSRFPTLGSLVSAGETNVSCDIRFGGCPFLAGFPLLQAFAGGNSRIPRVVPFRR